VALVAALLGMMRALLGLLLGGLEGGIVVGAGERRGVVVVGGGLVAIAPEGEWGEERKEERRKKGEW
jgi:hypothetical protein